MTKDYGYPSFDLICKASSGDETSIKEILNFYDAYISKLCLRPFYHENEYSNAIVHAFQKFRAPFSGKIVHIFPEQSAVI